MCAPPFANLFHRHFRRKESERQAQFSFRVTFTARLQQRKATQRNSEKRVAGTLAVSSRSIGAHRISLIGNGARSLSWKAEHPGIDSRRNPLVTPCVFSNKTHRCGMVSSASTRGPERFPSGVR